MLLLALSLAICVNLSPPETLKNLAVLGACVVMLGCVDAYTLEQSLATMHLFTVTAYLH